MFKKAIIGSALVLSSIAAQADWKQDETECMARNLYFEAAIEGKVAMFAVAAVTMNRVKSKRWPNTVCGVVQQKLQFSWFWDGLADTVPRNNSKLEHDAWADAQWIAKNYANGYKGDITDGADHYHTINVNPKWNRNMPVTIQLGSHIFYKSE